MSNSEFTDVLEELTELHNLKNQDYATSENPYKNLEGVERLGIPAWRGVVIRMMDKFSRLEEFCVKEELAVKDETIEDTFKDIAIYSVLAMILYRKRMEGKSNDPDIFDWRFLASIHKKRKGMEQELIENERGKGNSLFTNYDEQLPYHGHKLEYKPYVDTSELKIVKAKKNEVLEEKRKLNIKLNQLEDEAKVLVAKMNAEALDELDKMNE